jgi:hypothetical protein
LLASRRMEWPMIRSTERNRPVRFRMAIRQRRGRTPWVTGSSQGRGAAVPRGALCAIDPSASPHRLRLLGYATGETARVLAGGLTAEPSWSRSGLRHWGPDSGRGLRMWTGRRGTRTSEPLVTITSRPRGRRPVILGDSACGRSATMTARR